MKPRREDGDTTTPRGIDALVAIALQLRGQLDANQGQKRNLTRDALFLQSFGYTNAQMASILGSTPASIAELIRRERKEDGKGEKTKDRHAKGK